MPGSRTCPARHRRRATRLDLLRTGAGAFFIEQLLEARHGSWFPTNGAGDDEDVNIYLAHLLNGFVSPTVDPEVARGAWPSIVPPAASRPRAARAAHYRANADHRLLHLGLFDRGDALRRRRVAWGFTSQDMRSRDLQTMCTCYHAAADLTPGGSGLATVLRKLAERGDDYVHVLQALAKRYLGLGARLDQDELSGLLVEPPAPDPIKTDADVVARLIEPIADTASLDIVLDLVGECRRRPDPELRRRLVNLAQSLGLDSTRLLQAAADRGDASLAATSPRRT